MWILFSPDCLVLWGRLREVLLISLNKALSPRDLPRVDIIYAHANQDSALIDAAVAAGAKGIVYAGMGNGSIHKNAFSGLERAANKGVLVVRSSRTGSGLVVDSNSEWQNFINAGSLNPQKARVLLQLALTQTKDPKVIQQYFEDF